MSHRFGPGQRFASYRILEPIGSGTYGEVYKARHEYLDSTVALKLLFAPPKRDEAALFADLFKRETRTLGRLRDVRHRNLIRIDHADVVRHSSGLPIPYISMDYIEGVDLQRLIDHQSIDPLLAVSVAADVASALSVVHGCGIVHRDIKPSNVRITPDQTTKLIDFGIAKSLTSGENITTKHGTIMGTLPYMPPERLALLIDHSKRDLSDARGDVYSTGKLLYHMLVDERMLRMGAMEQVRYHLDWQPNPPDKPGVYQDIYEVLEKALRKDPDTRYQSAAELHDALRGFLSAQSTSAHPCLNTEKIALEVLAAQDIDIDPGILRGPFLFVRPDAYHRLTGRRTSVKSSGSLDEVIAPRVGSAPPYRIGRAKEEHIVIEDPSVSGHHALLRFDHRVGDSFRYTLIDQGSSNGTFVNGRRYQERALQSGDIISLSPAVHLIFTTTNDLSKRLKNEALTSRLPTLRTRLSSG